MLQIDCGPFPTQMSFTDLLHVQYIDLRIRKQMLVFTNVFACNVLYNCTQEKNICNNKYIYSSIEKIYSYYII